MIKLEIRGKNRSVLANSWQQWKKGGKLWVLGPGAKTTCGWQQ